MIDFKKLFATFEKDFNKLDADHGQSLSEYIAVRYEQTRRIRHLLDDCDHEEKRLEESYRKDRAELQRKRAEFRKGCPHPSTTYYPDASGNNDSHTECDICGAEVTRHGVGGYDG